MPKKPIFPDSIEQKNHASPTEQILRQNAEIQFAQELKALQESDDKPKPFNWHLSPQAVVTYLLGGKLKNGVEISPKYIGQTRLIEIAVATLATDRALLLLGVPGTAKTWVSEHLAAAICGQSTLLIQGTAGIDESALRYGWNYARLLSEGPSEKALVVSPVMQAMSEGKIVRLEELTRVPAEVQDTLITILSEKTLPIPELNMQIQAQKGFNLIATANDRDKGVSDLSSALKRRFNTVSLPLPKSLHEEVEIVAERVASLGKSLELPNLPKNSEEIKRIVTIFRELRQGLSQDGRHKLKSPSGTLSPAEAISVISHGLVMSTYFGDGSLQARDLAASLLGAVVKDQAQDGPIWREYLETVVKHRSNWNDLYQACQEF